MLKAITFIRSIIFNLVFYAWTLFICTIMLWTMLLPRPTSHVVPWMWTWGTRFLLFVICGIRIKVKGRENLPKKNGYIVAAKHQSAMETALFHSIVPRTVYVLKKELLFLPVAGLYFWGTGCIPIDRKKGTTAMRLMLDKAKKRLAEGYNVIVFPEGTRVKPRQPSKYNPGVSFIYEQCNVPVVPIALNTGYFWPKNSFWRYSGTVTIDILPPIEAGLDKRQFLNEVESKIETACQKLNP